MQGHIKGGEHEGKGAGSRREVAEGEERDNGEERRAGGQVQRKGGGAGAEQGHEGGVEEEASGTQDEENEGTSEAEVVEPYEMPPLPRKLLAGRAGALEERLAKLETNPEDPRIPVAKERLERTKRELRLAGGRTTRRLYFGMVTGQERIKKMEAEVARAEEKVREEGKEVEKALRAERAAVGKLGAAKARLEKEKAAHAHRGFEVAVEASQEVEGFAELQLSVKLVGEGPAECGRDDCEDHWSHLARFVNMFGPRAYDPNEDADLRDLRSVDSTSTLGVQRTEAGDTAPVGARRLLDEEAESEQALIRNAFNGSATGEETARREESLQLVHDFATRAAHVYQAVVDLQERATRTQERGAEQEQAGAQGEGWGLQTGHYGRGGSTPAEQ